jgi:hypothetical protein
MAFIPPTGSFLELLNEDCDYNVPTDDGQVQAMLKKYAITFKKRRNANPAAQRRELLADKMWIHANHTVRRFLPPYVWRPTSDHCYSS